MLRPFVSVVTPFHNTVDYLAQCIESVLNQTYDEFEYILVDNCSTDGSSEIAEQFARRDSRIRLIRHSQLVSQVQNYNRSLGEMSEASRCCKMVQADDYLFPDCLRLMIEVFEKSESIGLVSSYWLKGTELRGSGFPYPTTIMPGKEMARLYLRTGLWVFGSPTTVMYRSSLIKKGQSFFDESQLHEDSQKCMEILCQYDFGFVPQILSFSRADNESISSTVRGFQPNALDRYLMVQRYASVFLDSDEAASLKKRNRREYYRVLELEALRTCKPGFWAYHKKGLGTIGQTINRGYLALQLGHELLRSAGSPAPTAARAYRVLRRLVSGKKSTVQAPQPESESKLRIFQPTQGRTGLKNF